jgi:antitoxin VapB
LPLEFRLPDHEVYIRRDAAAGDVILSERPGGDWGAFMQLRNQLGIAPADYLAERQQRRETRDPFGDWSK